LAGESSAAEHRAANLTFVSGLLRAASKVKYRDVAEPRLSD
jgi:hypothetical protein